MVEVVLVSACAVWKTSWSVHVLSGLKTWGEYITFCKFFEWLQNILNIFQLMFALIFSFGVILV